MSVHIRVPARASVWYTASAVIGRGVGFLFTPIFTRLLSEAEYGNYSLYLSWLGIFTIISTLEISGGIFMRQLQKSEDESRLFRSAILLELLTIGAICTLYFAFYRYISKIVHLNIPLSILLFLQIFTSSIFNLYTAREKFRYRYKSVFALNVLSGALPIPIALLLIYAFGLGEYGRISATVFVFICLAILITYNMLRHKKGISTSDMRSLFLGGLSLLPHFLSLALISRIDKLTVSRAFGAEALARYSVAENIGSLLLFGITAPLSALTPWVLRRLSQKEYRKIREVVSLGARLILWLSLILLSFAPELLSFLAPGGYEEALFAAYPVALAAIPSFLFTVATVSLTHLGSSFLYTIPAVVGAGGALTLALILAQFPHFTLLSFTQPAAQLIMLFTIYAVLRRVNIAVIDMKNSLFTLILGAVGSTALFVMKDFLALRLVISVVCVIPFVFELGRCYSLTKENNDN